MSEDPRWRTSVTEIVSIFRDALRALVPTLDRARIPWAKPQAYDDWDDIAQCLFKGIVVNSREWSFVSHRELAIPRYGQPCDDYRSMSFLEIVDGPARTSTHFLFRSFTTVNKPYDAAEGLLIEPSGKIINSMSESVLMEEAEFLFQHRQDDGSLRSISELAVFL